MTTAEKTLTVVLADGKELARSALGRLLNDAPDIEVVATAGDEEETVRYVRGHHPDVLLYSARDGQAVPPSLLEKLGEASPDTQMLVLSPEQDPRVARDVIRLGAQGFISEDDTPERLLSAVRRAAAGQPYLNPALGVAVASLEDELDLLTEREREILRLIALGYTNQDIASELYLSVRTVESHRAHIMTKLDVNSRKELVAYALKTGLVP